ncbi:MAG TPA: GAF domain-containing protein, partial [Chloroflexota bacterium]
MTTQEQQGNRASILVARGDSAASARVAATLREAGHAVRETLDVPETLAALDLAVPDLLVLDLPGAGGRVLLDALRSHPIRSTMAILALDGQQDAAGLLEAGVDDVLSLPLNQDMLRIKVQTLIRLKHAERAARELIGRRARDQHALQRASERLAACPTLFEVLTVAAELVRGNLGYDRVSIAHFDPIARTLHYVVGTDDQGRVHGPIDPPLTVSLREGSPLRDLPAYHALFLQGQETYYVPDTAGRAPAYFRPALDGPMRESLLVAMRVGDQVVGLITVDNLPSGRPFGPDDSGLLVTLARQVGLAVRRAGQTEALQARAEDAEGLARAGAVLSSILDPDQVLEELLDQAARLLPYDHGTVLLRDGEWARIAAARGAGVLPTGTHVIDMRGAGGEALIGGTTLSMADVTIDPLWRDFPLWAG